MDQAILNSSLSKFLPFWEWGGQPAVAACFKGTSWEGDQDRGVGGEAEVSYKDLEKKRLK